VLNTLSTPSGRKGWFLKTNAYPKGYRVLSYDKTLTLTREGHTVELATTIIVDWLLASLMAGLSNALGFHFVRVHKDGFVQWVFEVDVFILVN
jgi:hypothetical protein